MTIAVALIDDHPVVRAGLKSVIDAPDHIAVIGEASSGEEALTIVDELDPDVVLCDLRLGEGIDGIEVCRRLRASSGVPIIMLTARTDTVDVVVGLESGVDDYVSKPFKPQELIARVRARLRRGDEPTPERLSIGDLSIDVAGHSVKRDGEPGAFSAAEQFSVEKPVNLWNLLWLLAPLLLAF